MSTLWFDLETYCEIPIANGTYAYAEKAEVLLFAYAIDDGPAQVWDLTKEEACPAVIEKALCDEDTIINAHNSQFDRNIFRLAANATPAMRKAGNQIHRWRDTMIKALAHSLPGSLDKLCGILRVPLEKAKDKEGNQLIQLFCKPRPINMKLRRATSGTHPDKWFKFVDYARLDVEAMREVDRKLPNWNYQGDELALWHLDQKINDRGFLVDLSLAHLAIKAVEVKKKHLAKRAQEITSGAVQAATQRDALLKHLFDAYGVALPDLQRATLDRYLADDRLPFEVRELIKIRVQASTSSTSKYKTLVKSVSSDCRLKGTLQFNGAMRTGRWSGRLFQPHNLPRPNLKQPDINAGIDSLLAECSDLVYPDTMELTSNAIRGCIIAPTGKKLVVADLSNIEGRALAWLSGEEWKLKAFADYDKGIGHDLYKLAYARSFSISPVEVDKEARQIGKVMELALGYEGGVGAFLAFSQVYGLDLEKLAEAAIRTIPQDIISEANSALAWAKLNKRSRFGLVDNVWVVCDSLKRMWRYAHPKTVAFWISLQSAVSQAIANPDVVFNCRVLKVQRKGAWLRIRLPSGRCLCYPSPQIDDTGKVSYTGVNQYSRKWERVQTHGGKLVENVTQAFSRDVLAYNMPEIEQRGYEIVLSVHDELLTETPDTSDFNCKELSQLMATNPPWAEGLPLAAAGFEGYRYRKG